MYTLVVGASTNPSRYSYRAMEMLSSRGLETKAFGLREGEVAGIRILTDRGEVPQEGLDTITLYVGPARQEPLKQWVSDLKPRRIIFNPGTENPEWEQELREEGILVERACTLVMLSVGNY